MSILATISHAFNRRHWLVLALVALLALASLAAGRPASAADDPTPEPTATTAPTATATTQPPVVVIVNPPPSAGDGGGGGSPDTSAPILMVSDYHADPSPVKSGQSFVLTVTVKNTGTKYAQSIAASVANGSSFVGTSAPVELGQLDPGQSATFALSVQAARQASGPASLTVLFQFRVGEGGEQAQTRSVGLNVDGGSGVSGEPLVVVAAAQVTRPPSRVGDRFEVSFVLRNAGTRKAYGLSAALASNEALSPAEGSGATALGDLNPGQAVTLTVPLVLNQSSPTGRVTQTLDLSYRDGNNTDHDRQETTSLDLGPTASQSAQLVITRHQVEPAPPAPGETFTLTVEVKNVGAGTARAVLLRLGDLDHLGPFVPLTEGNVSFAEGIPPGGSATFTHTLLMKGDADGGAYALPAQLTYQDGLGQDKQEDEVIGVLAMTRPQLQIGLTKPLSDVIPAGQGFDIPVELINIGPQRVEVNTVEVVSEQLALTKNSLYVGPLDASISGGLTAKARGQAEGPATFTVIVHYRDDLNQPRTLEQTFSVQIGPSASGAAPAPATGPKAAGPGQGGWWQALLRFVGLGS